MSGYKSTIKARSFLYLELKKAASLYLQGCSLEEIKRRAVEENIFLLNTENRSKEIAATIARRIKVLDQEMLVRLTNGNLETSKQLALYTILKTDRMFFEFMREVVSEKYFLKDHIITGKDFNLFFQRKAEQSRQVASWSDYTFYKLQQVYKRILIEAGLAKKNKRNLEITRSVMDRDMIEHLENKGEKIYLQAMLGG